MFVASSCYWFKKKEGIFQYLLPQKYDSLTSPFFICNLLGGRGVRILELLSIKQEFITIYVSLLPFYIDLCWTLSAFLWIKVWNTLYRLILSSTKQTREHLNHTLQIHSWLRHSRPVVLNLQCLWSWWSPVSFLLKSQHYEELLKQQNTAGDVVPYRDENQI